MFSYMLELFSSVPLVEDHPAVKMATHKRQHNTGPRTITSSDPYFWQALHIQC